MAKVLSIPAFRGLWQRAQGAEGDARYAAECQNALTSQGVLRPMAPCETLPGPLPAPIVTLCRLHRRYHPDNKDVLIAAAGGQLYWRMPLGQAWTRIDIPPTLIKDEYESDLWSCVSFEINPEGATSPIDVLLLSNARDGMICVRGDDMTATAVSTPRKFGVIGRHAERIWGGAIEGDADMLCYSAPYDPFNWTQNDEIPEDGAGEVLQPSWDGDSFTALIPFGSQLIAFQRTRAWRILGLHPGEYSFKEQYGGGARWARTVVVDTARVLLLGREGLCQYDGEVVAPFGQDFARNIFDRMNFDAMDGAAACMHMGSYYLALPLDGSRQNNAVLIYNTLEDTWLLREDIDVGCFLSMDDALYLTSIGDPGYLLRWKDEGDTALPMRWLSPWQEAGDKHTMKSGFAMHLIVEAHQPVPLTLGIQTEKQTLKKTITFRNSQIRRVFFRLRGRRFRLLVESAGGVPWRMPAGVQIDMEVEE